MNWKRWRIGLLVSCGLSLVVAGSGLVEGMKWQSFVVVLCTALVTHLGAYLKEHPVEQISFDGEPQSKTQNETNTVSKP